MGIIDKALAVISPKAAANRLRHQQIYKVLESQVRKFDGASKGRRFPEWDSNASTNAQISQSLETLRVRSRDLARNNPYAAAAPGRIANNVIGTGILATPTDKKNRKQAIKQIKQAWKNFAEKIDCDFNEQLNFYGIQRQCVASMVKNGEAIIKRVWKSDYNPKSGAIPFELQVLDPDLVDTSQNTERLDGGGYIISGVEYDANGKRVAYHIYNRNPKDFQAESKRIPKKDIIHLYKPEDPGQVRGLPDFTSVILRMKDFDKYEDAQLAKQIVSACFAAFIQDNDSTQINPSGSDDIDIDRLEPGIIEKLPAGKTMAFANPPSVENYGEYSRQNLQGQAVGLGMTYENFTGDYSNVNFSSGRMGWIEFRKNVEYLQWLILVPMFLNRVWGWFLEGAVLAGLIPDAEFDVIWTAPRMEMIDPSKEIKGLVDQVRAGFLPWQDAVRQLGYTPEEIMNQLLEDKKAFDESGLNPTCDPRFDAERMKKQVENKNSLANQKNPS